MRITVGQHHYDGMHSFIGEQSAQRPLDHGATEQQRILLGKSAAAGGGESFAAAGRRNDCPQTRRRHALLRAGGYGCGLGRSRSARSDELIKGFAVADHAQLAAGAFFERSIPAVLQIGDFGPELTVALDLFFIRSALYFHRRLQPRHFALALIREPKPVLEQDQCKS
jgi:hypothetical protein